MYPDLFETVMATLATIGVITLIKVALEVLA